MTGAQLLDLWAERDGRYATRTAWRRFLPLTPAEERIIVVWRDRELAEAIGPGLTQARAYHADWTPPRRLL